MVVSESEKTSIYNTFIKPQGFQQIFHYRYQSNQNK